MEKIHITQIKKLFRKPKKQLIIFSALFAFFYISNVFASNHTLNLTVSYKTVDFAGKKVQAIAVNNQIPAPTLHFKEGDHVVINVFNHLNEPTIIHWHGIILPWQMDGVEGVSQHAIPPGKMFQYHFTLRQSGTYWYHAHAGFQEQQGLYGAFIIDPKKPSLYKDNKDEAIVLSDWSNTNPNTIFENLKRDGDYYSPRFPLQASLFKFIHDYKNADPAQRKLLVDDYKMMQQMRMGIYDFSDVAYDAFLLNGKTNAHPWTAKVKAGDVVRLRFIDAGGSTNFNVKIPGYEMRVIQVQGNDVKPYSAKHFFITPGETLDALITIKKNKPTIIYAESSDTVGAAMGALITSANQIVNYKNVMPFPEPKPVTQEMMNNMMQGMNPESMGSMHSSHGNMSSSSSHVMEGMSGMKNMQGMKKTKKMSGSHEGHTSMSMSHDMPMKNMKNMPHAKEMPNTTKDHSSMKMNDAPKEMNHQSTNSVNSGSSGTTTGMAGMENMQNMKAMKETKSTPSASENPATMPISHDMLMKNTDTSKEKPSITEDHSSMKMNMPKDMSHESTNSMSASPSTDMGSSSSNKTTAMVGMEMKKTKKMTSAHKNHTSMNMPHDMHTKNVKNMNAMENMQGMGNSNSKNHTMNMSMPTEASIIGDHFEKMTPKVAVIKTFGTKYQNLIALHKTNNPNKPIAGVIRMELFGYMDRYIWMINGVPEYKAKPIILQPGKRYRIIFTNPTMMHHPMHMHGHWFILRNGHGAHDPLLHTIDVAPGATVVADVDTDASGQWFFHCHLLYHMMGGMARVFQYQTLINIVNGSGKPERFISKTPYYNRPIVRVDEETPIIPSLVHHPMGHPTRFYTSNFLDVGEDAWNNTQEVTFKGMYGGDYNKLKLYTENSEVEKGKVVDADMDIFYWRLISQFWAIEGGANYTYRPAQHPYLQPGIGIDGLMPYFIDTEFRLYEHDGSIKFDPELSRDTQITNNFFIRTGIEAILATKTVTSAAIGSGLNEMQYTVRPFYRIRPGMNIFVQYQYTKDYGALRQYDQQQNESPNQNLYTLGLTLLF